MAKNKTKDFVRMKISFFLAISCFICLGLKLKFVIFLEKKNLCNVFVLERDIELKKFNVLNEISFS